MLTRKDFEAFAKFTRDLLPRLSGSDRAYVIEVLADTLADTNPRFDRARFVKACYPREDNS